MSIEFINYSPFRIGSPIGSSSPSVPPQHSWWPYLCNIHHPNSLHLIHFQEVFEFAQASYWRGEGSCLHTGHSSKYEEIIMECSKAPMKKEIYDLWFFGIGDVCKLFHTTPLVFIELINSWSNQSRHAQAHVPFDIRSHVCSIHSVVAPQHIWWARLCSVHHHHNIQDFFYWKREGSCRDTGHNSK